MRALFVYINSLSCILTISKSLMWFQSSPFNPVLTWFPAPQETWISIAFLTSHYSQWSVAIFCLSSASILCSVWRIMFCYHAFLKESHLCFITHYFPVPETSKRNQNIPQSYFFLVHLINETFFYTHSQTWKIWRKINWLLILSNTLKGSWKYMLLKRCYFSWAS